jgi:NAD(P)-dependent dehydrogenase (short-subunit alcohol dehydrogenase family)
MAGELDGRIVAITGAGRGIGRAEALELGRLGARVVVNNRSPDAGEAVVAEIRAAGGEAVLHVGDVSEMAVAQGLVQTAIDAFGGLDALVNNAGMVRDRMLVNMSEEEWDEVVRVNLKGCFAPLQQAARYWRDCSKTAPRQAAIINTTSAAGLFQNVGQTNYAAAKAGVASLTVTAAIELARYGITVNAVSPFAATEMSAHLIDPAIRMEGDFDRYDPGNVGPLIGWLCGPDARDVTGRVFQVKGTMIGVVEGWLMGPDAQSGGGRWTQRGLSAAIPGLVKRARPAADFNGRVPAA